MEQKNAIKGPQTLVSRDKSKFIVSSYLNKSQYVCAPFSVVNGENQPSLQLDINRVRRCRVLLKTLPSVFRMSSDGKIINLDVVHKLIDFRDDNKEGIIQYHMTDIEKLDYVVDAIFDKIPEPEQVYIAVEEKDETKYIPNTLKVFPTTFLEGTALCIMDSVEKVLHTPILEPDTGLLGVTNPNEYKRIMTIQNTWPELSIEFMVREDRMHVYSRLLKDRFSQKGYLKFHRNFGGTDISVNMTHIVPNPE